MSFLAGEEMAPITVVAFREQSYSPDGKNLVISLLTKYSSAERKYSVPLECLGDLLVVLQRLQTSKREHSAESLDQDVGAHLFRFVPRLLQRSRLH